MKWNVVAGLKSRAMGFFPKKLIVSPQLDVNGGGQPPNNGNGGNKITDFDNDQNRSQNQALYVRRVEDLSA